MFIVTATQIIAEIGALPQKEKRKVIQFTRHLEAEMPMSGDDLSVLADQLAGNADPVQAAALRDQIMKAFYGDK